MTLKIKEQYKNTVIGFNNCGDPLGLRNDLHLLYKMAVDTKQENILEMFEDRVSDEVIEAIKVDEFIEKHSEKSTENESAGTKKQDKGFKRNYR